MSSEAEGFALIMMSAWGMPMFIVPVSAALLVEYGGEKWQGDRSREIYRFKFDALH